MNAFVLSDFYNKINRVCIGLLIAGLGYFGVRLAMYAVTMIATPFQNEYREGVMLLATHNILQGINPYLLENQPVAINVYGIMYNLLVSPFAWVFGNTLAVHRVVSVVCILGACAVVYQWLRKESTSRLLALSGSLLLLGSLLFYVIPTARPDGLGELLFLLMIFLPLRYRFGKISLMVSCFLGIAAFYTKLYFILGIAIVASYLFLYVSKKTAVIYILGFTALLAATIFCVCRLAECYFLDVLFVNGSDNHSSFGYMLYQLMVFGFINLPIIGVIAINHINISGIRGLPASFRQIPRQWVKLIDGLDVDAPLIKRPLSLDRYSLLVASAVIVCLLGQHYGQFLVYFFQLITPFLVIVTIKGVDFRKTRAAASIGLLLLNLYFISFGLLGTNDPSPYLGGWQQVWDLIGSSKQVFNSPAVAAELILSDKTVVDAGQNEYYYATIPYSGTILAPKYQEVVDQGRRYRDNITQMVKAKIYDCLIITDEDVLPVSQAAIEENYQLIQRFSVGMPQTNQEWHLQVWIPRQDRLMATKPTTVADPVD